MAGRQEIPSEAMDALFRLARSQNAWSPVDVPEDILERVYELARWGPTSANCFPIRVVFARSPDARRRLADCAYERNRAKILAAPVTAIVGYDLRFHEWMPWLFPHDASIAAMFANDPALARETAFRNGTLQGAFLMIAARSVGLDCGPMSGFDADAVNAAFFPDGRVQVNFICALGYGEPSGLRERLRRPAYRDVCRVE